MENNGVINFDPIKAEVAALVENVRKTVIIQPGDITGYELMKSNKSVLQKKRKWVNDTFKSDRDFHTAHNKLNIEKEKEILSLIEPLETELGTAIDTIDESKRVERRKLELPERQERLAVINCVVTDEELLAMDKADFESFFTEKKSAFLEAKEQAIAEAQAKIDAENKRLADEAENARLRDISVAKAKADAEEATRLALLKAETDKIEAQARADKEKADAIAAVEAKAAKDKQDMIDAQARKDKEAKDEADRLERVKLEAEAKAKEEQKALDKMKKYKKFLADNNYNEETDRLTTSEIDVVIYRKIATFIK
jgi:hypothetical protein